jgi:hypothetical protein
MSQELQMRALTLVEQAKALVVNDQQSYAAAVELAEGCGKLIDTAEQALRPSVKKAYDAYKSMLGVLQGVIDPAGEAKKLAGGKAATWKREEERKSAEERLRREEAARQEHLLRLREAEEERRRMQALADAEAAEAAKAAAAKLAAEISYATQQGATQDELLAIVETPLDVPPPVQVYVPPPRFVPPPPPPKPVSVGGESGRVTWKAEVVDEFALIKAVAAGTVDRSVLSVNLSALNKLVSITKERTNIPGVRAFEDISFVRGRK